MGKLGIGWILAASTLVLLFASGNAAAAQRNICFELTSNVLGVTHDVTLNFTEERLGSAAVYGKACYTISRPGGSVSDCAPVDGTAIVQPGRVSGTLNRTPMLEIELHAVEHHELFDHAITTESGTHIWLQDLTNLTGTWAAQSVTTVEGVIENLQQFDAGTVKAVSCGRQTDEDKQLERVLRDTLNNLDKL